MCNDSNCKCKQTKISKLIDIKDAVYSVLQTLPHNQEYINYLTNRIVNEIKDII